MSQTPRELCAARLAGGLSDVTATSGGNADAADAARGGDAVACDPRELHERAPGATEALLGAAGHLRGVGAAAPRRRPTQA